MELGFRNARENLCHNYKTVSGLDPGDYSTWYEVYRDVFCDKLKALGCTTDEDYSYVLTRMNKCSGVGDFLADPPQQLIELAAFGLISFDRIVRAIASNASHEKVVQIHEDLAECCMYVLEDVGLKMRARAGAKARHTENHAMKAEVFQWLDSQAKFKSNEAAAMAITKQQPIAHVTARDWFKEWKKLRSASTP